MPEKEEKEQPRRKPKTVAVRVVARKDESALVEWEAEGDLCRAYVPASKVEADRCDEDTLAAGIPYGVPWEDLIDLSALTPESIGVRLRRREIWTAADVERNIQVVQRTINETTGLTPARLHTLASQYEANKEA